jgi:hypothetical protein
MKRQSSSRTTTVSIVVTSELGVARRSACAVSSSSTISVDWPCPRLSLIRLLFVVVIVVVVSSFVRQTETHNTTMRCGTDIDKKINMRSVRFRSCVGFGTWRRCASVSHRSASARSVAPAPGVRNVSDDDDISNDGSQSERQAKRNHAADLCQHDDDLNTTNTRNVNH